MEKLIPVQCEEDIPEKYRDTSIAKLVLFHNLNLQASEYKRADMVVLMCMDNRQRLKVPINSSFMVRNSGGILEGVSFSISFAVAVGKIRNIAIIGHSDCMMVRIEDRREDFVQGLSENGGWDIREAEDYFSEMCARFRKDDAIDSVIAETGVLRSRYPRTMVAPLFYSLEDDRIYFVDESNIS